MIEFSGLVQTTLFHGNLTVLTTTLPVRDTLGLEIGIATVLSGPHRLKANEVLPVKFTLTDPTEAVQVIDRKGAVYLLPIVEPTEEHYKFSSNLLGDTNPRGKATISADIVGFTLELMPHLGFSYQFIPDPEPEPEPEPEPAPFVWESNLTWAPVVPHQPIQEYSKMASMAEVPILFMDPLTPILAPKVKPEDVASLQILSERLKGIAKASKLTPMTTIVTGTQFSAMDEIQMDYDILQALKTDSSLGELMQDPTRKLLCLKRLNKLMERGSVVATPFGYVSRV